MSYRDDTGTKPSRINRRKKMRWKISELGLTTAAAMAILCASINRLAGICNPERQGVKTPNQGVFLHPKKIITALIREVYVMAACSGESKGSPEPCPGIANPLHAVAQRFATVGGGLFLRQGATA